MDVSSCPSHPALSRNPSIKQLPSVLTTVASPRRFHSLSFIHFFLSSSALSLPIIISCPQTASVLVPVSAGLSNSPALISQLLQMKRGRRAAIIQSPPEREEAHVSHPGRAKAPPAIYGAVRWPGIEFNRTERGGQELLMLRDPEKGEHEILENTPNA